MGQNLTARQLRAIKLLRESGLTVELSTRVVSAQVVPSAPVERTFFTPAEVKAGIGFPCTAPDACKRVLKTKGRAAIHGIDAGGHAKA